MDVSGPGALDLIEMAEAECISPDLGIDMFR